MIYCKISKALDYFCPQQKTESLKSLCVRMDNIVETRERHCAGLNDKNAKSVHTPASRLLGGRKWGLKTFDKIAQSCGEN